MEPKLIVYVVVAEDWDDRSYVEMVTRDKEKAEDFVKKLRDGHLKSAQAWEWEVE